MEAKKPYVRPELEELGAVHDVTGDLFDILGIFGLGGRGGGKGHGSH